MKELESKGSWGECAKQARLALPSATHTKAWILRSWVKCAYRADRDKSRSDEMVAALKAWGGSALLSQGPWAESAIDEVVKARLWVAEKYLKSSPAIATENLNLVFEEIPKEDKKSRARAWALLGELSLLKHNHAAAGSAFEQSLKLADSKEVQEKYNSVLLVLSQNQKNNEAVPEKERKASMLIFSEAEQQFEQRFQNSSRANDPLLQMEDCVSYLAKLPNGLKAKWAQSRIIEIHSNLWDRAAVDSDWTRARATMDRVLSLMEKVDVPRVAEWLPVVFRRGDYRGALRLAEKLSPSLGMTVDGSTVLWLGGRSAQLAGETKKAERFFNQYLESHLGGEMVRDVQFQWALIHIRNKNYSSAVALLERLLKTEGSDKLDLNSRYWLVRSLQALGNPSAGDEIKKLIELYPFSYYGIRLKSELSSGVFEWPVAKNSLKDLKGKIYLNPSQKKSWDRLQWLKAHGWLEEAQLEGQSLPVSKDPTLKVLLAQEFAKFGSYPSTIRLVNEAGDQYPDYRSADILQLGLPKAFLDIINAEAATRKLSPFLVRSLIRQESGFATRAVSTSNALGLMQLIPPTAREVAQDLKLGSLEIPEDVFDPQVNIKMGTSYIARMIRQFENSVPLGLAAYNAGPRKMQIFLRSRPELRAQIQKASSEPWDEMWFDELPWYETSFYVKAILRNSLLFKTLDQRRITLSSIIWQDLVQSSSPGPISGAENSDVKSQ